MFLSFKQIAPRIWMLMYNDGIHREKIMWWAGYYTVLEKADTIINIYSLDPSASYLEEYYDEYDVWYRGRYSIKMIFKDDSDEAEFVLKLSAIDINSVIPLHI
jgi:hypothetical protein